MVASNANTKVAPIWRGWVELGRALEAILKKQPASPDVIFYALAKLAYRYQEQAKHG